MNTGPRTKETRTENLTGHVGRAINAQELITNNNPSIQEGKEVPATAPATKRKRSPQGPISEQYVHTQRLKSL